MAKTLATKGNNAQFTYDFGIAIAQSTISKITKLTGASLSLAGAYYAVQKTAEKYVNTLRSNTLFFGGILNTMKLIEESQNRLLKGQSRFDYDDQINGLNRLMQVGVDVRENFEWIDKSAHAMGVSFTEFSNAIAQGIQGSMGSLVQMGLLTERATRMFDKYEGNTIMRQQAILNFVKSHKGLQNAINNDFMTMRDQVKRLKASWQVFLQSIVGKPNDPNSLYGQATQAMKTLADGMAEFTSQFKKYGYIIGQVTGWLIRQVAGMINWFGRKVMGAISQVWTVTDAYEEQARSLLVWLEFWKLKILDFLHKYKKEIKAIFWMFVGFKALKGLFIVSDKAILSVARLGKAWKSSRLLQKRYIKSMEYTMTKGGGKAVSKFTLWLKSLAAYMPKWFRRIWVFMGRFISDAGFFIKRLFVRIIPNLLKSAGKVLPAFFKGVGKGLMAVVKKAGWIGWIVTAVILAWKHLKGFKEYVMGFLNMVIQVIRFIYNLIMTVYVYVRIGLKKLSGWFTEKAWPAVKRFFGWFTDVAWPAVKDFFGSIGNWIADLWDKFMDTRVGKWIDKIIVQPIKWVIDMISKAYQAAAKFVGKIADWFKGKNKNLVANTEALAAEYGISVPMWHEKNEESKTETPTIPTTSQPSNPPYSAPVVNPIIDVATPAPSFGGGETTQVSVQKGAIQIIVQKGEDIDENKLAQMVVQQINDLKRQGKVRGGDF